MHTNLTEDQSWHISNNKAYEMIKDVIKVQISLSKSVRQTAFKKAQFTSPHFHKQSPYISHLPNTATNAEQLPTKTDPTVIELFIQQAIHFSLF